MAWAPPDTAARTRRTLVTLVIVAALLALCATAPAARAAGVTTVSPIDTRSDRLALAAYDDYLRALVARAPTGRRMDAALVGSIHASCQGALAPLRSRPAGQVSQTVLAKLGEEIGGDLDLTFLAEAAPPLATLSRRLSALRWSTRETTRSVAALLRAERTILRTRPSRLCADARQVTADPRVTPAATTGFLTGYTSASARVGTALKGFLHVLGQFETLSEHRVVDQIDHLAGRFSSLTAGARKSGADQILRQLGLS
jgi:hypothetical protein